MSSKKKAMPKRRAVTVYNERQAEAYDEQDQLHQAVCRAYLNFAESVGKVRRTAARVRNANLPTPNMQAVGLMLESVLGHMDACVQHMSRAATMMGSGINADRTHIRHWLGGRK